MIKYRVHEVAKDFKTTSKVITEILTKYAATPKNHMQVLTDNELNIIFDYLTLHNQIADMSEVFADAAPPKPKEETAAPAEEKPEEAQKPEKAAPAAAEMPTASAVDDMPSPKTLQVPQTISALSLNEGDSTWG